MAVPVHLRQQYKLIASILEVGCSTLHPAYYSVCLEALEALCCMRNSPIPRSSANVWAGGILHAVGNTNLLFHPLSPGRHSPWEVLLPMQANPGTAALKSLEIRKMLHMNRGSLRWMRPALEEGNPRVWWISLRGGPEIDVRTKPPEVQETAVRLGLIPVAPARLEEALNEFQAGENPEKTTGSSKVQQTATLPGNSAKKDGTLSPGSIAPCEGW